MGAVELDAIAVRSAAVFVASVYLWGGVMIIALNSVVLGAVDVCVLDCKRCCKCCYCNIGAGAEHAVCFCFRCVRFVCRCWVRC